MGIPRQTLGLGRLGMVREVGRLQEEGVASKGCSKPGDPSIPEARRGTSIGRGCPGLAPGSLPLVSTGREKQNPSCLPRR